MLHTNSSSSDSPVHAYILNGNARVYKDSNHLTLGLAEVRSTLRV